MLNVFYLTCLITICLLDTGWQVVWFRMEQSEIHLSFAIADEDKKNVSMKKNCEITANIDYFGEFVLFTHNVLKITIVVIFAKQQQGKKIIICKLFLIFC